MPEDSMDCGKYRKYWTDFQYLSSVFGIFRYCKYWLR